MGALGSTRTSLSQPAPSGAAPPARRGLPPSLGPLRYRGFALFWGSQLGANIGVQVESTASAYLLYALTHDPLVLSLAGLARGLPVLALTLFAGTIADRVSAKRVLWATQSVYGLGAATIWLLLALDALQPWHLIAFGLVGGFALAFDATARQALYPSLVPREVLPRAVPLNSMIRYLGLVTGPSIAGVLLASPGGVTLTFGLRTLSVVGLLVALAFIHPRVAPRADRGSIARQTLDGLQYVAHTPVLAGFMVLAAAHAFIAHSPALMAVYAQDVLQVGPDGLGLLLGTAGAGAVVGSLLSVAVFGRFARTGWLQIGLGFAYAAAMLAFALSSSLPVSVAACVVLGICQAGFGATSNTVLQIASPEHMRGRVMALYVLVSRGFDALSPFQVGLFVGLFGAIGAGVANAVLLGGTIAGVAARLPAVRAFSIRAGLDRPAR